MTTLQALEQCEKNRKYTVFGFIRKKGEQLSLPHIPTMIDHLCLLYYSPNTEFFDKCNNENGMKLSVDRLSITSLIDEGFTNWTSIFGYHLIESLSTNKHEWLFDIKQLNTNKKKDGGISFGLEKDTKDIKHAFISRTTNYAVTIYGKTQEIYECVNGRGTPFHEKKKKSTKKTFSDLKDGTKVRLILNNGKLSIRVNNHIIFDEKTIKTGLHIKYRMAVSIAGKSNCVVLKKYVES